MPRTLRHIPLLCLLIFGGLFAVAIEGIFGVTFTTGGTAQAAPMARAVWNASTKTLTFYYGEQKSGGTTHYSGTQITASGTGYPAGRLLERLCLCPIHADRQFRQYIHGNGYRWRDI
ncbi:MAG: hypothetical protein IJ581_04240 [Paludibacteraceae bacterium]|nr:hypothetical protein [Paludibacteraceae bacterium]